MVTTTILYWLWWISVGTGGILVFLLVLSLAGGIDLDVDIPSGDIDVDADVDSSGGLGLLKGILTIVSVSCWVIKIVLELNQNPIVAVIIGLVVGYLAFWLLNYLLKTLLTESVSEVNFSMDDIEPNQLGTVYLKIPSDPNKHGLIHVVVRGAKREFEASSMTGEIETGATIQVFENDGKTLIVKKV